jgi:hypothetical protein
MEMGMQKNKLNATLAVAGSMALATGGAIAGCGGSGPGDSVLPGVEAVVFVQRAFERDDLSHDISGGSRQVIDYQRYTPGGGVFMLSPPTPDGQLTELTASFTGVDIAGLDLSFDANEVVFSMRHAEDDHYHVYTASIDGSSELHQITFGDWDDIRPIYVPGHQIAFVTNQPYTIMGTRADEYEHSREVTQIAVVSLDGGDPTVCAQNLSHTADPFLLSDGQIGYSRWEHLGPVNDVKLFRMNPDCTGMEAIAGQFNKDFNSIVQASEIEPGVFVAIGTSRSRTIQSGAVIHIDARSHTGADPLRIDVQQAQFENLTPAVPTGSESPPTGVGRYRNPRIIPETDQFLVSWSDGDVNDRNELATTAPQFGIYMLDPNTERRTLVYDDPGMWDLYAIPVAPRTEPRAIPHSGAGTPDDVATRPAIIGNIDVAETSLGFETVSGGNFDGTPLHDALLEATHVRVIEGFSAEIGAVGQFGLTMHEGAAILGETPVQSDGSWRAAIPAYTPVHLQPLDRFGLAIRNQMLWIQGMPGESRTCGGCHSSRSGEVLPREGTMTTLAQQLFPQGDPSTFRPIPDRTELPWYGAASHATVQDLFDARCVSCHDGGSADPYAGQTYHVEVTTMEGEMLAYDIPYLNLSSTPLEVYYEREVVSYPASYVTLLYPSAMMDATVTGTMPPIWVEPGSARHSRMVEVVNAVAEDDASVHAWADRPLHPEDVGVTLTPEERRLLIQMADLGGQYYSRFNVDGAANWAGVTY